MEERCFFCWSGKIFKDLCAHVQLHISLEPAALFSRVKPFNVADGLIQSQKVLIRGMKSAPTLSLPGRDQINNYNERQHDIQCSAYSSTCHPTLCVGFFQCWILIIISLYPLLFFNPNWQMSSFQLAKQQGRYLCIFYNSQFAYLVPTGTTVLYKIKWSTCLKSLLCSKTWHENNSALVSFSISSVASKCSRPEN